MLAASDRHEEWKEDEDFEDLEEVNSGGELGPRSTCRDSMTEAAMSKEWTRGVEPALMNVVCSA